MQSSCMYELIVYTRTVQDQVRSNSSVDRELWMRFNLSQGAIFR